MRFAWCFYREMVSGKSGSLFSVPLICEDSRFLGLGDGQFLKSKFQFLIPLMEFIASWKNNFISTFTESQQKLSSKQNWLKNQTSSFSKKILGFVHILEWIPNKLGKFINSMRFYL